jgi:hypothetical protein
MVPKRNPVLLKLLSNVVLHHLLTLIQFLDGGVDFSLQTGLEV